MITALIVADVVLGILTMLAILLQTGYTAGMAGAFGGGGPMSNSAQKHGADAFLERSTTILAVLFAVITAVLAHFWH
ncbi:MAG: preprotein translocase subunit SecG [Firmicutes bacterium]|nr:preprotein translocase subunit SecG [Bacillota bacterium]